MYTEESEKKGIYGAPYAKEEQGGLATQQDTTIT
jgi:hypothetical protein